MSKLDEGAVEITLDGETLALQPTIEAAKAISRQFGGFQQALAKIARQDFDACAFIAAAGLNRRKEKEAAKVAEKVYVTGLLNISDKLTIYVVCLMNGGKIPTANDEGEGAGSTPAPGERQGSGALPES